ncbi:MAG: hypothetical protein ACLUR5_09595 [Eubacterium ventriosum]
MKNKELMKMYKVKREFSATKKTVEDCLEKHYKKEKIKQIIYQKIYERRIKNVYISIRRKQFFYAKIVIEQLEILQDFKRRRRWRIKLYLHSKAAA